MSKKNKNVNVAQVGEIGEMEDKMVIGQRNDGGTKFTLMQGVAEPVAVFSMECFNDICAIIDGVESGLEVSWLCRVERQGSIIMMDKVYIPEQENEGATTEMTQDGYTKIYLAAANGPGGCDEANKIKAWFHLHPWTGDTVGPSGQDDTQFLAFGNPAYKNKFFVRGIFNKDKVCRIDIIDFERGFRFDNVKWKVAVPAPDQGRIAEIKTELTQKVRRLYAATRYNDDDAFGYGYGYGYRSSDDRFCGARAGYGGGYAGRAQAGFRTPNQEGASEAPARVTASGQILTPKGEQMVDPNKRWLWPWRP